VFADTLITYWKKIVITDPRWRPDPGWRVEGGFDHGKTKPHGIGALLCGLRREFNLCRRVLGREKKYGSTLLR
jgi:hypothetical protein